MKLPPTTIATLTRECVNACRDATIQRINDGRPGEIVLQLRKPGANVFLLLAAGDDMARLHLATKLPPKPERPTPFVMLLRKHLSGTRLSSMEPIEGDRVVMLDAESRVHRFQLVAELTGRHGNLFLLDSDSRILGSLRANISHRRKLVSGEPYVRPSPPTFTSPNVPPSSTCSSRDVEERANREIALRTFVSEKTALERDLRRALKRARRRQRKIETDLSRADRAEQFQRWGELLQQAYGKAERGLFSIELPDFYDPELEPTTVPLDPALDLGQNIARYFKQSRRLKAARAGIRSRLDEATAQADELRDVLDQITAATDLESFHRLERELLRPGLLRRATQQQRSRRNRRQRVRALPYREFESATGRPILVGRGAKSNDQLTFRIARGRDLWLHADGAPGSHVIVRLNKGQEIDGETLIDAATLAAQYSSRKNDTTIDVRYARQRDVRKLKGAPSGQVTVSRSKVIAVRVEPERLERLFATA